MNLWDLKILILTHYLIKANWLVSFILCDGSPSHTGLRMEQMVFRALCPPKTILTKFQMASLGKWFYSGVLNCHMTLCFPKSSSLPLEKMWITCFLRAFVNFSQVLIKYSDIGQSSENGFQKKKKKSTPGFLHWMERRHSIYTILVEMRKKPFWR